MNRVLRCYASGNAEGWQAICIDLDIAVEADSREEVVQALGDAVVDYLEYVSTLPVEEQSHLLNRRSPWWEIARLSLARFFFLLRRHNRSDDGCAGDEAFSLPCPA